MPSISTRPESGCIRPRASRIITLYGANQQFQLKDGADPEKLAVIPNGIDLDTYGAIDSAPAERPTIALIGRRWPWTFAQAYLPFKSAI